MIDPDDVSTAEIDVSAFQQKPLDIEHIQSCLERGIQSCERAGTGLRAAIHLMKEALRLVGDFHAGKTEI